MAHSTENSSSLSSEDLFDARELYRLLLSGLPLTLGLTALGIVAGVGYSFWANARQVPAATLYMSVDYDKRGEGNFYPDDTPFQSDDIRAASIVQAAALRANLSEAASKLPALQTALGVEGVVPIAIIREKEKQRTGGQALITFHPNEFKLSFTRPIGLVLTDAQRQRFLTEVASAYRDFYATRLGKNSLQFSRLLDDVTNVDYRDYYSVFQQDLKSLRSRVDRLGLNLDKTQNHALASALRDYDAALSLFADQVDLIRATKDRSRTREWAKGQLSLLKRQELALKIEDQAIAEVQSQTQGREIDKAAFARAVEVKISIKLLTIQKSYAEAQLEPKAQNDDPSAALEVPLKQVEAAYLTVMTQLDKVFSPSTGPYLARKVSITQPATIENAGQSAKVTGIIGGSLGLLTGLGLSLSFGSRRRNP